VDRITVSDRVKKRAVKGETPRTADTARCGREMSSRYTRG